VSNLISVLYFNSLAVSKKRLDKIESYWPEVKDSASIDLEWIPYKGKARPRSLQLVFARIGVTGLYFIYQDISQVLLQRKHYLKISYFI
jgi:hypothetical protein